MRTKILSWLSVSNLVPYILGVGSFLVLLIVLRSLGIQRAEYWASQSDHNAVAIYILVVWMLLLFWRWRRR
jgi:hypothetical protein